VTHDARYIIHYETFGEYDENEGEEGLKKINEVERCLNQAVFDHV